MGYTFKINIANRSNYGKKRSLSSIKYIAIHYTANDGDTDEGNGKYFKNNVVKVSSHYFVDDDSVTQSVPDNYVAYTVGGNKYSDCSKTGGGKYYKKATNSNTLNIEICDDIKNGVIYPSQKTIENAIELTKKKMKEYNIPKENVIRHFDVTGKKCPAYWCGTDEKNSKWKSEFWNKLSVSNTDTITTKPTTTTNTTKPSASSSASIATGVKLNLKNVALYSSSTITTMSSKKTGVYYVWSKDIVNNRIRITNSKANVGKSGQVTGWIKYTDAKNSINTNTTTTTTKPQTAQKSLNDWAKEVINGKYGNGHLKRAASLKKAGCPYSYTTVQARVNRLLKNK